jgi:hypothetical protein
MAPKFFGSRSMQLELMWQCGGHHGCERFAGNLLAHSAEAFSRHVPGVTIDRITPAARLVLRRTAASSAEGDLLARRLALAWLAFDEVADAGGPGITITIRRSEREPQ